MIKQAILKNKPRYNSLDKTREVIHALHQDMMIYGAQASSGYDNYVKKHPKMKYYALFVSSAMEYNDELKILRSKAIYQYIVRCQKKTKNHYWKYSI